MFKKSILVVLIQATGLILALISVYFIAGNMAPMVYSLIGVYVLLSSILTTFSHLGVETTMMREALYWEKQGEIQKVKEHATQALLSRLLGIGILFPFLLAYIYYLCVNKYDNQYFILLLTFLFGSSISALNDSMSLIVRSEGDYVFAQFAKTINNDVIKCVGILIFFIWGETLYLYFYAVSSIPLLLLFYLKTRRHFDFHFFSLRPCLVKIKESKFLWLKQDVEYFKSNADALLVSLVFPASIMGSYTLYKNLENMAKGFIEGFFDVLSQNSVKYKCDPRKLSEIEKKFKKVAFGFCFMILVGVIAFLAYEDTLVSLINLSQYEAIGTMIACVGIVSILYLVGKYESNAIAFFGSSKMNFNLSIVLFVFSLLSFLIVLLYPVIQGVLIQRLFIFGVSSLLSIILFKKNKELLYTTIAH